MPDIHLQSVVQSSRRRVGSLLTLWRQMLLDSLPADILRLIEGRARPHRISWDSSGRFTQKESVGGTEPVEVVLDLSCGLIVDFDLPAEAEANLQAIVTHQIPVQTPFTSDQIAWAAGVTQRAGRRITVQLVLCPNAVIEDVVTAASRFDGPLVAIRLEGAAIPHQLLPALHQRASQVDREIHLGRKLVLANVLGFVALIAVGLHGQVQTVSALNAQAVQLRSEADAVRQLRAQLSTLEEEQAFLQSKSVQRGTALQTLESLSEVVHSGAWLDQLVITSDAVELGGYADTSATVLQAIDQSSQFANAAYRAPVRAQRGGNIERFSIAADQVEAKAQ